MITADTAIAAVNAGQARVDGWTKNDAKQDCVIVTNFEHSRTDHVAIGWQGPQSVAEKELDRLADEAAAE